MQPSEVMLHVREKVEEAAEKTGEVIGKGLMGGGDKAKRLGKDLENELLRAYGKTGGNKNMYAALRLSRAFRLWNKNIKQLREPR